MLPCTGSTLIWTLSRLCGICGCIADEPRSASRTTTTSVKPSLNADCMGLHSDHTCNSGCIFLQTFPLCPSSIGTRGTKFPLHLSVPRKEVRTNQQPHGETGSLPASGWGQRQEVSGFLKRIRRYLCPAAVLDREATSDFEPTVLSRKPDP